VRFKVEESLKNSKK